MTATVQEIVSRVQKLGESEYEELLSWLAEYQLARMDAWDREIERDSQPGGRLEAVLDRVRGHIASGKVEPLDSFLDNS